MCVRSLILLTGTIAPDYFRRGGGKSINVGLSDALIRLQQYETAIRKFILKSVFTDIVFIENSGYAFDSASFEKMAQTAGKRFEFIYLKMEPEQINQMLNRGKSYGEALLIDFAMKNSKLISEFNEVYKITGRIFLENSRSVVRLGREHRNEFIVVWPPNPDWVRTEFFKINKEDYFSVFENSFELCEDLKSNSGNCIERVWFRLAKKSNVHFDTFGIYPRLSGQRGSSLKNERYDEPWIDILKWNIRLFMGKTRL